MQASVYADRVVKQREQIPLIYGDVDFSIVPERYDAEATVDDPRFDTMRRAVQRVFDDPEMVQVIRDATMTGDRLADAYAALIPEHGFRRLVELIEVACSQGLGAVEDPPPELVALIESMEATPPWVDVDLVRRGRAPSGSRWPRRRRSPSGARSSPRS